MQTNEDSRQYLTFRLLDETFALGILRVQEIIEYQRVTRVPRMPAWVRGVINLRGQVVPVIDLALRFGESPAALTRDSCIVIVELMREGERVVAGLTADAVDAVIDLDPDSLEPPPRFGAPVDARYLAGVGHHGDSLLLVLALDALLEEDELRTVESVETAPEAEA